jgi:hypothetical protein
LADPQVPNRLLQIDEITRAEHYYIREDDVCYHLWEYVKGGRFQEHPTNQLILNLQIALSERANNPYRWRYKPRAIQYAANALSQVVPQDFFQHFTWIPIPPSGARGSEAHDPRLMHVLEAVRPPIPDIREMVYKVVDHTSKEKGLTPEERAVDYLIDERVAEPPPARIIVFDDVLTTGSHFKAMKLVLSARFPGVPVMGVFLARRLTPPEPSIPVLEVDDINAFLAQWQENKGR